MTSAARLPLTGLPRAGAGRRSAVLAAWATAHLQGAVHAERVVDTVHGGDEPHRVLGLDTGTDLDALLADLRRRRADGLRLVLPVPGDPRGIPEPGPLTARALDAGEAVVVQGGQADGYGLVPVLTDHGTGLEGFTTLVTWQAIPVRGSTPEPRGTLRQAEHDLADAVREAASELARLDVASFSPRAAAGLGAVRSGAPRVALPPSHPPAAARLLDRAERLAEVLELASVDDGAAVDGGSARARREALRVLAAVVRRARVAAVNAPLEAA
ncbi:MAG TPA: hypothetical protein VF288_04645 [Mycobacteriales bacterium]